MDYSRKTDGERLQLVMQEQMEEWRLWLLPVDERVCLGLFFRQSSKLNLEFFIVELFPKITGLVLQLECCLSQRPCFTYVAEGESSSHRVEAELSKETLTNREIIQSLRYLPYPEQHLFLIYIFFV